MFWLASAFGAISGLVKSIGGFLPAIGAGAAVYSSMEQKKAAEEAAGLQAQYQKQQQEYAQQQAKFQEDTNRLNVEYQAQQKAFQDEQLAMQKALADQQMLDAESARKMQEEMSKKSLVLQKEQLAKQTVAIPTYEENITGDMAKLAELDKKRKKALSLKKTDKTQGALGSANVGMKSLLGG